MNLRGYILGTMAANLALVGALLWQTAQLPGPGTRDSVMVTTNVVTEVVSDTSPRPAVVSIPGRPPFRWEQLEATNHLQFLTNLLAVGCPPETARDILEARVADDFRTRLRALTRPLQVRFWDVAAVEGHIGEQLFEGAEIKKAIDWLKEEREEVEQAVKAVLPPTQTGRRPGRDERVTHLPVQKQAQLVELAEQHTKQTVALKGELAKAEPAERTARERDLRARQEAERRGLFTDAEWAESELRASSQAQQVRELRGFPASPAELRALALSLREFDAAYPRPTRDPQRPANAPEFKTKQEAHEAKRRAFLTVRLGEAGFAAFERGSDPRFHTLLKLTRRLDQPTDTAVNWLALQTAAQAQVNQVRTNPNLSDADRAAVLSAIRTETERTLQAAVGARGWGAYQRNAGEWLKQLAP